ncbi:MAG: hypothetical protein EOP23_21255 [Hyphomicrobiales bacterium]|nr:MAG: hypothetical protein EOP23_21255 [Hyphomicrobiales bacterium]
MNVSVAVITTSALAIVEKELDGQASTDCEEIPGKCAGLRTGAQIHLEDVSGRIVTTANLGAPPLDPPENTCAWGATFTDVPAGGDFYTAAIGDWESPATPESEVTERTIGVQPK